MRSPKLGDLYVTEFRSGCEKVERTTIWQNLDIEYASTYRLCGLEQRG